MSNLGQFSVTIHLIWSFLVKTCLFVQVSWQIRLSICAVYSKLAFLCRWTKIAMSASFFALSQAAVKIEKWLPFAQNWTYSHETWFSICRSACFYE